MVENVPNLAKDINLDSGSWSKPKQDKPKEIHAQAWISKVFFGKLKTKKNLEGNWKRNDWLPTGEQPFEWEQISN